MKKQPNEIIVCNLAVVLMPNSEIISSGKSLGFFKDFKDFLTPVSDVVGNPIEKGTYD